MGTNQKHIINLNPEEKKPFLAYYSRQRELGRHKNWDFTGNYRKIRETRRAREPWTLLSDF